MTDPVSVEAIYKSVIEDTIYKLSPEFENAGVSMQVLSRLQQLWMMRMQMAVRNPTDLLSAAPVGTVPPGRQAVAAARPQEPVKAEQSNGGAAEGAKMSGSTLTSPPAPSDTSLPSAGDAIVDSLKYTVSEPLVAVKQEMSESGEGASNGNASSAPPPVSSDAPSSSAPSTEPAPEPVKPEIKDESDSSDVSDDDDDIDTSSWSNSLMSLFNEPVKRNKDKRTFALTRGILHVNGQDYLFKSGKAEILWE